VCSCCCWRGGSTVETRLIRGWKAFEEAKAGSGVMALMMALGWDTYSCRGSSRTTNLAGILVVCSEKTGHFGCPGGEGVKGWTSRFIAQNGHMARMARDCQSRMTAIAFYLD